MKSILIAASSKEIINPFKSDLETEFHIQEAYSKDETILYLKKKRPDLIFIDLNILSQTNDELINKDSLKPFLNLYPTIPIVILAPQQKIRYAVQLIKSGASDYMTYPVNPDEVRHESRILFITPLGTIHGTISHKRHGGSPGNGNSHHR